MGVPIDYDAFAARWDDPQEGALLKKLVKKFDGSGLLINTHKASSDTPRKEKTGEVEKMAKRATKLGK